MPTSHQELDGRGVPLAYEALLDRVARDAEAHTTAGPASEADLAQLEATVGRRLPAPYRRFLEHLGGGIYYQRHELFGPTRVMIHDIELLPPITSACRGLPPGVLAAHRAGTTFHFMDLRPGLGPVPLFSLVSAERYADFAAFLQAVIVPSASAAGLPDAM